jgi:hypothetical protein
MGSRAGGGPGCEDVKYGICFFPPSDYLLDSGRSEGKSFPNTHPPGQRCLDQNAYSQMFSTAFVPKKSA